MPPKKKKGGTKKRRRLEGELTIDDKYKKTLDEIEALKDHLAIRKEFTRRARTHEEELREKMEASLRVKAETEDTHRAVSADMTRQYKTMQSEMGYKVSVLEAELAKTKQELELTSDELQKTREAKDKMEREKNDDIAMLNLRLNKMESQFDRVFNDALDALMDRITAAKPKYEDRSTYIQAKNKQTLLEFGLNPLDI